MSLPRSPLLDIMKLPPELRLMVATHLEVWDLLACMRVSRTWYNNFSELAYRTVKIEHRGAKVPEFVNESLWRYCGFIQELVVVVCNHSSSDPLFNKADPTKDQDIDQQEGGKQGVVLFPRLKRLFLWSPESSREVERWLSHCPNLMSLRLRDLDGPPKPDADNGEAVDSKDRGLRLLRNCPRLTRLEIDCSLYDPLEGYDWVNILNHWPPLLTEFVFDDFGCPVPLLKAMSGLGFLTRISVLDVYQCEVESWMFERIVCSCPLLVELRWPHFNVGTSFSDVDVAGKNGAAFMAKSEETTAIAAETTTPTTVNEKDERTGAWACNGLRKLDINLFLWSSCHKRNRAAMAHLGLLKELRHLFVGFMTCGVPCSDQDLFYLDLDWPVYPFGYLVYPFQDIQTAPEASWIREIWPLLEYFDIESFDYEKAAELEE